MNLTARSTLLLESTCCCLLKYYSVILMAEYRFHRQTSLASILPFWIDLRQTRLLGFTKSSKQIILSFSISFACFQWHYFIPISCYSDAQRQCVLIEQVRRAQSFRFWNTCQGLLSHQYWYVTGYICLVWKSIPQRISLVAKVIVVQTVKSLGSLTVWQKQKESDPVLS